MIVLSYVRILLLPMDSPQFPPQSRSALSSDNKEPVTKKKSPLGRLASLALVAGMAYIAKRLLKAKQSKEGPPKK